MKTNQEKSLRKNNSKKKKGLKETKNLIRQKFSKNQKKSLVKNLQL